MNPIIDRSIEMPTPTWAGQPDNLDCLRAKIPLMSGGFRIGISLLLMLVLGNDAAAQSQPSPSNPPEHLPRHQSNPRNDERDRLATTTTVKPLPHNVHQTITPRRPATSREDDSLQRSREAGRSPWRILGVLVVAVAGIVGVVKLIKFMGPLGSVNELPTDVCEILGVTTIPPRHVVHFLRIGPRILIVGSSGERLTVLSEITDPAEVESFTVLCTREQNHLPGKASTFFHRLLSESRTQRAENYTHLPYNVPPRQEADSPLGSVSNS